MALEKRQTRNRLRSGRTLQRRIMQCVVGLGMLVCAGVMVGWYTLGHEGRDVRVKQAALALQKGRPDLALRLINPVLVAEPNDLGARMLVIQAHVKMLQFRYALSLVNQLVMLYPDRLDLRRGRIDVLMAVLEAQLSTSTASDEVIALGTFEALLTTVTSDVDVVSDVLDAHKLKMMRIRLASLQVRDLTRTLSLRPDDSGELDAALRLQWQDAQSKLETVLKQMLVDYPRQFEAWRMYIELLVSRNDVTTLGQVADILSRETILPPAIATELVQRLVFVDATRTALETRLALGERLQAAVHPRDRADIRWVRTRAMLSIVSGQAEGSLTILDRLPRHQRNQTAVLLIRARALSDLGRFTEVVDILQPLALQQPYRADIQTLLALAYTALGQLDDAECALRAASGSA